ncbi:MAG: hypothetical protein AB9835_12910 [Eubacteriales bacterium]
MAQELYSQMNTLVRVKESKMLSRAQKLSLIHASDIQTALRQLGEPASSPSRLSPQPQTTLPPLRRKKRAG